MVDDVDEKSNIPRTHEETSVRVFNSMSVLAYNSWTRAKASTGTLVEHSGLLTLDGTLLAKLTWRWSILDGASIESEKADLVLRKDIIDHHTRRVHRRLLLGPNSKSIGSWDVLCYLASFAVHYGPRGDRYCLLDFITGHEKVFTMSVSRVVTRSFQSSKRVSPSSTVKSSESSSSHSSATAARDVAPPSPEVALQE